jgi:hypothetical protein
MRVTEIRYKVYAVTEYKDVRLIRAFHHWNAFSATDPKNRRLLIILDEYVRHKVTICEYDDMQERDADIEVLQTISEDITRQHGGNNSGTPPPPSAVTVTAAVPVAPLRRRPFIVRGKPS